MKKIVLFMCVLLTLSMLLVGCGDTTETPAPEETLKFGMGIYVTNIAATDATEDKNGSGTMDVTVAAVTVDANGKIVACDIDTASNTAGFTLDGKAVAVSEYKTKKELGADYNMVAYGGAAKEWFEQVDAFEKFIAGKTLTEVKALVADGNKGNADVQAAGCTIKINEFVGAVEKAYNAAAASKVTAKDTVKVAAATEQTCTDATEEKDGSNKLAVTVFGAAVDANGKIVAASSDCVEVSFTFTAAGVSTLDATKEGTSKKEKGADYGMVAYGGAAKEWFEQAAAFDAACIGKTGAQIASLMANDGKGTADVQAAGCTIYVSGFVKAATKI